MPYSDSPWWLLRCFQIISMMAWMKFYPLCGKHIKRFPASATWLPVPRDQLCAALCSGIWQKKKPCISAAEGSRSPELCINIASGSTNIDKNWILLAPLQFQNKTHCTRIWCSFATCHSMGHNNRFILIILCLWSWKAKITFGIGIWWIAQP